MTSPDSVRTLLEEALDWWRESGVESAEVEAILAAPTPSAAQRTAAAEAAKPAPVRPTRKASAEPGSAPADAALIRDARALAAQATSLAELRAALERLDLPLKRGARLVFADGVEGAPVLLIGEAPGREEDAAGKPFVGRSGKLLDRMLEAIGLTRERNVFISNVIFWRPPANRPPTQVEIAACAPFVERLVALAQPKLVVAVGGFAAQTLLKRDEGVMRLRGKRLSYTPLTEPVNALVMLHPAYLLRRPQDKALAWSDVLALADWADALGIERGPSL